MTSEYTERIEYKIRHIETGLLAARACSGRTKLAAIERKL